MDTVTLTKACPFCKTEYKKEFPVDGYRRYRNGEKVQDCFPEMSADDREFLITGICQKCWDKVFRNPAPSVNKKRRELGLTKKAGGSKC